MHVTITAFCRYGNVSKSENINPFLSALKSGPCFTCTNFERTMEGVNDNVTVILNHVRAEPTERVVIDLEVEQRVDETGRNIQFAYRLTVEHQSAGSISVNDRINMLQSNFSFSVANVRYDLLHRYQLSFVTPHAVVTFPTQPLLANLTGLGRLIRWLQIFNYQTVMTQPVANLTALGSLIRWLQMMFNIY